MSSEETFNFPEKSAEYSRDLKNNLAIEAEVQNPEGSRETPDSSAGEVKEAAPDSVEVKVHDPE